LIAGIILNRGRLTFATREVDCIS